MSDNTTALQIIQIMLSVFATNVAGISIQLFFSICDLSVTPRHIRERDRDATTMLPKYRNLKNVVLRNIVLKHGPKLAWSTQPHHLLRLLFCRMSLPVEPQEYLRLRSRRCTFESFSLQTQGKKRQTG
jgi:hypothetical protein